MRSKNYYRAPANKREERKTLDNIDDDKDGIYTGKLSDEETRITNVVFADTMNYCAVGTKVEYN